MPRAGFYSPSEADQVMVRIEEDVRVIRHRLGVLGNRVKGSGQLRSQIDEIEEQVDGVADGLCDLVDQRTEAGVGG
jgi:hypothetical protein